MVGWVSHDGGVSVVNDGAFVKGMVAKVRELELPGDELKFRGPGRGDSEGWRTG